MTSDDSYPTPSAAESGPAAGLDAVTRARVELVLDSHRITGALHYSGPPRRLVDVLNAMDGPYLPLYTVEIEGLFGAEHALERFEVVHLVRDAVLFAVPVAAWATARWRVDEWRFLRLLVTQDLLQLGTTAMDGLGGPPWYYLDVIQRHHYDWLVAGIVGLAWLPPGGFARIGRHAWFWRRTTWPTASTSWWTHSTPRRSTRCP